MNLDSYSRRRNQGLSQPGEDRPEPDAAQTQKNTDSSALSLLRTGTGLASAARPGFRGVVHDLFWFVAVPAVFVFAPLIAWALRGAVPVTSFHAAGLSSGSAELASQISGGLLLFSVSGWLFLLAVWFFRTPDPDRNFIDYCRGGMVFALLLYVWALAPSLVSLLVAVFTKFFTKGSV